jgi:hypothetical protein
MKRPSAQEVKNVCELADIAGGFTRQLQPLADKAVSVDEMRLNHRALFNSQNPSVTRTSEGTYQITVSGHRSRMIPR